MLISRKQQILGKALDNLGSKKTHWNPVLQQDLDRSLEILFQEIEKDNTDFYLYNDQYMMKQYCHE